MDLIEQKKRLDIAAILGNSIAQAIVEDFLIFDVFPLFLKAGEKISLEVIRTSPEIIEATGSAVESMGRGYHQMATGTGKMTKDIIPSIASLIGLG